MKEIRNKSIIYLYLYFLIFPYLIIKPNCLFICFSLFCQPRLKNLSGTHIIFHSLSLFSLFLSCPLFLSLTVYFSLSLFLSLLSYSIYPAPVIIIGANKKISESQQMKTAIITLLLLIWYDCVGVCVSSSVCMFTYMFTCDVVYMFISCCTICEGPPVLGMLAYISDSRNLLSVLILLFSVEDLLVISL